MRGGPAFTPLQWAAVSALRPFWGRAMVIQWSDMDGGGLRGKVLGVEMYQIYCKAPKVWKLVQLKELGLSGVGGVDAGAAGTVEAAKELAEEHFYANPLTPIVQELLKQY